MSETWKRALVTGASSGIGRSIAQQLADAGTDLVVVARDAERLTALADALPVDVEVLTADLGDPAAVAAVAERVTTDDDPIDLLVNNAGLGFAGPTLETTDADDELTVAVNVVALHRLCRAAGAAMQRRGGGAILNVSSIAGDMPGPQSATYNATKAFVTSFSEALHVQLKPAGVTVTALCPGLTRTEFQERAGIDDLPVPDFAWQTADEVAAAGLAGVAGGRAVVVPGMLNLGTSRLLRSLPRGLTRGIVARART
ncbi:MAG: SDR family oxidoreductase [Actinomycetota bacterium]